MARSDVERDFPLLRGEAFELSDEDFNYNCLAYALGDYGHWWQPPNGQGNYWPPGFPNDVTVKTAEQILRLHGFTKELDSTAIPDNDAVAIYAEGEEWTHFAKFKDGVWGSKLGDGHDVVGVPLQHLEGFYGNVVKILCRPKDKSSEAQ